ncbi:MAG: hypothetical protein WD342_17720 [Verrucomicrobiales bacterium]
MRLFSTILVFSFLLTCFLGQSQDAKDAKGVRGFVGVEPFEVRLEALVDIEPYRGRWALQGETIADRDREAILADVAALFESGVSLSAPNAVIDYADRLVRFVRPDPEKGYIPDERESIPLDDALVGLTFSADAAEVEALEIEWRWFAPGQDRVPIEIASRGSPSARYATPDDPVVTWKLDREIAQPELQEVPDAVRVERAPLRFLLAAGLGMWIYGAAIVLRDKHRSTRRVGWLFVGGLACGVVAMTVKTTRFEQPNAEAVDEIVYALLRNTYHAFDFRDESAIYDTLEHSVTGSLLEEVYIEVRSSLELENQGGPRVRVYEIALRESERLPAPAGDAAAFRARAEWVTVGEVTHWGHTHERTNRYEADLTVAAKGEDWKISGLELLNEERVQKVSRRTAAPES